MVVPKEDAFVFLREDNSGNTVWGIISRLSKGKKRGKNELRKSH